MKRFSAAFFLCAIVSNTFFGHSAYAGTNDFFLTEFSADYDLSRDSENRSVLKTTERITASFPAINQNHGIERALPTDYHGHKTRLLINSVTDDAGAKLPYSTSESNGNKVLRIGDAGTYVHGVAKYVITYEQRDVTKFFTDTDADEFYWDTNGTEWDVPIMSASARVHMPTSLANELSGNAACYVGQNGSGERCQILRTTIKEATTFTIPSPRTLAPGENITFSLGFQKGTFLPYSPSLFERFFALWQIVTLVSIAISLGLIIWLSIRLSKINNRHAELGTIVPEYLPPKEASVTTSGHVIAAPQSVMTAQLLDLAVRHYLKIYEVKEKSLFRPAEYEVKIVKDLTSLRWEEREILSDMFAENVAVGTRLNLKKLQNSMSFYKRTMNNDKDLALLMKGEYALREKRPENVQWFRRTALILLVLSVVLLLPAFLFTSLIAFVFSYNVWSLTDKGLDLRRYLEGLKLYIKVAEIERLKMLQSPEGVAKVSGLINGTDTPQLLKLYERVLPYAVLFGQEKAWSKQLGTYYESVGTRPDWYAGNSTVFNAVVFSSAMNSFTMSTTTYVNSSSSSSSGSGGGGSSGGGGGGGGGGGW